MPKAATKPRKPAKPKPLERDVQKECLAEMAAGGWVMHRRNTGAVQASYKGKSRFIRFSEPGMSDTCGYIPRLAGRAVEVEIKRPGEKLTYDQAVWLDKCHRRGVVAFWVDSRAECAMVVAHINRGREIQFLPTKRTYSVKIKGAKKPVKIEGPSGDYELV